MHLTPYVPTDNTVGTVDPLGSMRPFGILADQLFRQFTILTHHPGYHGFLCFALQYIADNRRLTNSRPLGRAVREIEILWGLINCLAGDSILNTMKFGPLIERACFRYKDCLKDRRLFDRLPYGALGHYTGPSRYWGLLNDRAGGLEENGRHLASAWGRRGVRPFERLLTDWLDNHTPADGENFIQLCRDYEDYALSQPASAEEQAAWVRIIKDYCRSRPLAAPLWGRPVSREMLPDNFDILNYQDYFAGLINHYQDQEELTLNLIVCQRFEELIGLAQTVFNWEYARCLPVDLGDFSGVKTRLVDLAGEIAPDYLQAVSDARLPLNYTLARGLTGVKDYGSMAQAVLEHHSAHQRNKGGFPYFSDGRILIQGRVDPEDMLDHLTSLRDHPDQARSLVAAYQARDWHFGKALFWLAYAGEEYVVV